MPVIIVVFFLNNISPFVGILTLSLSLNVYANKYSKNSISRSQNWKCQAQVFQSSKTEAAHISDQPMNEKTLQYIGIVGKLAVVCSSCSCQEVAATITVHQLHHSKLYRSLEYGNLNFTHLFPNRSVSGSSKLILSNRHLILETFISYSLHFNYLPFIILFT